MYSGLTEVISLYEKISGIENILEKAIEWKKQNPKYAIQDKNIDSSPPLL